MNTYKYMLPKPMQFIRVYAKKRLVLTRAKNKDNYHYENYQVFQHEHLMHNDNITIEDVDDYLEAVKKLKKEDKNDYFMAHGLDYDRCYEYVNVVRYQNRCWQKPYNKVNKQDIIASGRRIFNGIVFIYYFIKNEV